MYRNSLLPLLLAISDGAFWIHELRWSCDERFASNSNYIANVVARME
jgi:hypothetical protein